jgi:hypothetical protein
VQSMIEIDVIMFNVLLVRFLYTWSMTRLILTIELLLKIKVRGENLM